ncbi:hypothetical protein [Leptospira andrefontaineae]|uniref:Uncharacterized protein n=1 Tax=Leptospira andrefontaineae TaxID=2484976 RepID=A0A4R9H2Z8_9LEPT|nr:hypothetical protein [Leptospira andrefontaineae]TGK39033.1 hypothetical protein EHO65_13425 [Leptospira andrefontaineae]
MKMVFSLNLFSLLVLIGIVNCSPIQELYWRRLPHKIEGLKGTFLKLALPKEISDGIEKIEISEFYVSILKEDKESLIKKRILINPNRNLSFWNLWFSNLHYIFPAGCELDIPIPEGENLYEIHLGAYRVPGGYYTYLETSVNLKPNESLRLTLYVKGRSLNPTADGIRGSENLLKNRIGLKVTIEQNPSTEELNVCKFE